MATIYVGPTSAGSADGTSWANRYGSLNAAEDRPVAAGDVVYVGAGTYRELLTCDVSGASEIAYIGDVTGANTDGVGGVVRVTASDDDQGAARTYCVTGTSKNYRTFQGFLFDSGSTYPIYNNGGTNWVFQDCTFQPHGPLGQHGQAVQVAGAAQSANTFRRCVFYGGRNSHSLVFTHSSTIDNAGHLVENCLFVGSPTGASINIERVGGITVRHCTFLAVGNAIKVGIALSGTATAVGVYNCLIYGANTALQATAVAEMTENYNCLDMFTTARSNVNAGANSVTYIPLFQPIPLLNTGRVEPWRPFSLHADCDLRNLAGETTTTDDLYGTARPQETDRDWGAVEALPLPIRETTITDGGSGVSLNIPGRGFHDVLIPVADNTAITVTVKARWGASYTGTKPQAFLLADYGVALQTATATGDGATFETLTLGPVTPQVPGDGKGWMVLRLQSNNTAATNQPTYFDTIAVS